MSDYSLNGLPLLDVRVTLHRTGAWTADVLTTRLSNPNLAAGGQATLSLGPMQLAGTILRGGSIRGSEHARIVGGKGGLGGLATAAGYQNATAQVVVNALLSGAKESLATSSDTTLLGTSLPFWTVRKEPVATALTRVTDTLNCVWRVLTDGTVWLGNDASYPQANLTRPTLLDAFPERGEFLVGINQPELLPGQAFSLDGYGGPASAVEYRFYDGKMRMTVWTEDAS
jgi:hypothetical protein